MILFDSEAQAVCRFQNIKGRPWEYGCKGMSARNNHLIASVCWNWGGWVGIGDSQGSSTFMRLSQVYIMYVIRIFF